MQPPGNVGDSFEDWFVKRYGATVHARLARALQPAWPIELRTPPLPITAMEQGLQWHKYRTQDPGLVWLRGLLRRAVQRMDGNPGPSPL